MGAGRTWALPREAAPRERCACPGGRTYHAEALMKSSGAPLGERHVVLTPHTINAPQEVAKEAVVVAFINTGEAPGKATVGTVSHEKVKGDQGSATAGVAAAAAATTASEATVDIIRAQTWTNRLTVGPVDGR